MNKLLLDTNIFIYALDKSSSYNQKCKNLLEGDEHEYYTTTKNISEYFSVASKLEMDFTETFRLYEDIKQNTKILFPTFESLNYFEQLMLKHKVKGNKVYDLEVVSLMLANFIPEISTVNVKDFKIFPEIKIRSL